MVGGFSVHNYLSTFVLVNQDKVIGPVLTTIREYGTWFERTFDEYTAQQELYMKSRKQTGESVLEWHPGTRIGKWFDTQDLNDEQYKSWFILQDSTMMDRLVKLKLAEYKDAIPISVNDVDNRRMIRVYTVPQIELYIRNLIDKNFSINEYISTSKQIKVKDSDFGKLIMPKVNIQKKRLF